VPSKFARNCAGLIETWGSGAPREATAPQEDSNRSNALEVNRLNKARAEIERNDEPLIVSAGWDYKW
jgi:hypothetical protein